MGGKDGKFAEDIPAHCPPDGALALTKATVLRLVEAEVATPKDFLSHVALGLVNVSGEYDCGYASCSVFASSAIAKLPLVKGRNYIAEIEIDDKTGLGRFKKNGHIDLWMYKAFDPIAAIKKITRRQDNA